MIEITNKRGNSVEYGESPHMINLTADSQILMIKEPLVFTQEENYLSDNKTEEDTLVFQD